MSKNTVSPLDENTRRYYLDVMGVQCWELRDAEKQPVDDVENNREVVSESAVTVSGAETGGWSQLDSAVQQCDKCPLHTTREQAITGRGNQSADLMFILLAPSADASADTSANTSTSDDKADALFSKMLAAINVNIEAVYITSLLKCSVPDNHTVSPKEIQQCNDYLKQQIQLIQPELLVVLGETAARCLLQKDLSIDDIRAMNNQSPQQIESVPLYVSYSAQELLSQAENKRKAWSDLQQIQKIMQS